jgi:hypothetical protein
LNTPGGGFLYNNVVNKDYVDTALSAVSGAPIIILGGNGARSTESVIAGATTNITYLSSEFNGPVGQVWFVLVILPPQTGNVTTYSGTFQYDPTSATNAYWYKIEVKLPGSTATPTQNSIYTGNLYMARPYNVGAITTSPGTFNITGNVNNASGGTPQSAALGVWIMVTRVR